MQLPSQIVFRDLPRSNAIETDIRKRIKKLSLFSDHIMHCDVEIEKVNKNPQSGKIFLTKITITVPGRDIVINRKQNEDIYVALRDAFNAARRQLKNYERQNRGQVKHHELPTRGLIITLLQDDNIGFINSNGIEYYFTQDNVVHPDFNRLKEGQFVHFIPTMDRVGHRAHRVSLMKLAVGKKH